MHSARRASWPTVWSGLSRAKAFLQRDLEACILFIGDVCLRRDAARGVARYSGAVYPAPELYPEAAIPSVLKKVSMIDLRINAPTATTIRLNAALYCPNDELTIAPIPAAAITRAPKDPSR